LDQPVLELLTASALLGIAGIDPLGALIGIRALAAGTSDRVVVAYVAAMVVVTTLLGTVLSLTVGSRMSEIDWSFLDSGYGWWATGEVLAGALLLVWAIRRVFRTSSDDGSKAPYGKARHGMALVGAGVVFGLGAVLDPTFVSLVVLAGRDGALVDAVIGHFLWITISQLPAVLVGIAILSGRHTAFVARFQGWWQRISPVLSGVGTVIAVILAVILLLDGVWWFSTGDFLTDF
jgi:hypothetical protein